MTRTSILSAAALLIAPAVAQQADTRAQYAGQSWTGLLVAASCPLSEATPADAAADLSTSDRVTTPAVDDAGVRGSSQMNAGANTRGDKVPFTGDIEASRNDRQDPGWRRAKKQASHLGDACRVSGTTDRFALMLPDGRSVRFDQLANQKVAQRIRIDGRAATPKIFRVHVTGKLQNGAIALDNLDL